MHGTVTGARIDMRWTDDEDELVREHYLDKAKVAELLPHRSYHAIRTRATHLRVAAPREKEISGREEKKLKELVECFSSIEVIAAIMGRKATTVHSFIKRRRWTLKLPAPAITGRDLFDEVRRRAFEMKISFRDLDRSLGYRRRTFSRPKDAGDVSIGMIKNAVEALGGRLVIEWEPLTGGDDHG